MACGELQKRLLIIRSAMNHTTRKYPRPGSRSWAHHTEGSAGAVRLAAGKHTHHKGAGPEQLPLRRQRTPAGGADQVCWRSEPGACVRRLAARSVVLAKQGAAHCLYRRFHSEPQRIASSTLLQQYFPTIDPVDSHGVRHTRPSRLPLPIHQIEDQRG